MIFQHEGRRIGFEVRGGGTYFVLIAGAASPRQSWEPIADQLVAAGHGVVLIDNEGVGESSPLTTHAGIPAMAADVCSLLDHIGLHQVVVVGHSMGTMVALELALQRPDMPVALVLLAGPRVSRVNDLWRASLVEKAQEGPFPDLESLELPFVLSLFPPQFVQEDENVDAVLEQLHIGGLLDIETAARHAEAIGEWIWDDRHASLGEITAPTLVISFGMDVHAPPRLGELVATELRTAEHLVIPDHAHSGVVTASNQVATAILAFLTRVRPTTH